MKIGLPAAVLLAAWVGGCAVEAAVPSQERIEAAIAAANRAAGRSHALRLKLVMRVGDQPQVAVGELMTDPTGVARLELRGANGLVERRLLQGNRLSVARNGLLLGERRELLPPLFLLQAGSGSALGSLLAALSVGRDEVGLGECGGAVCLILGDPDQAIPVARARPIAAAESYATLKAEIAAERARLAEEFKDFDARALDPLVGDPPASEGEDPLAPAEPIPSPLKEREIPAMGRDDFKVEEVSPPEIDELAAEVLAEPAPPLVFVDRSRYEIRGLVLSGTRRVSLGPDAVFEAATFPSWIRIETPGKDAIQFDVLQAVRVSPPASAFGQAWLLSPFPIDSALAKPPALAP